MKRRVMIGKRELVEVVEELKSSGTWMVPAGCKFVDVFIVGGGGSGASSGPERGGGGGGSGYVKTYLDVPVTPESVVSYSIGKGGDRVVSMSAYDDQKNGLPGSESWFKSNSIKALGGNGGRYSGRGGDGGSGGGSGRPAEKTAGYIGGSDGSNGAGDMPGIGQGSTTRCPFNNKLYAGGGGGGGTYGGTGTFCGGGGAGGDIQNHFGLPVLNNVDYPLTVGVGGKYSDSESVGGKGGDTIFLDKTASGGNGGTLGNSREPNGPGGSGTFKGGAGDKDGQGNPGVSNNNISEFNDGTTFYSGGGGGGSKYNTTVSVGGKPNGASGAMAQTGSGNESIDAGVAGIGGGGGGGSKRETSSAAYTASGSKGGNGLISIKLHY